MCVWGVEKLSKENAYTAVNHSPREQEAKWAITEQSVA